jgi:hypothetical protein
MKIALQNPFIEDFKSAYLLQNKEPRNLVLLVRNDNTKTSMSYARYLMSCHLNRFLGKDEHVDHIDGNKLNDTIENLQILSLKENNQKRLNQLNIKAAYITLECPICKKQFTRRQNKVITKLKYGKKPCCSRRCGGIKASLIK